MYSRRLAERRSNCPYATTVPAFCPRLFHPFRDLCRNPRIVGAGQVSRGVMHSLPVLEQEVGAIAGCDIDSGSGKCAAAVAQAGWGLGGTGPVLKTQTIVSIRRRTARFQGDLQKHPDNEFGVGVG